MEIIFDGTNEENSKTQGRKGHIRKIQKNKKERMKERKRKKFYICGGSTFVFSTGWGRPQATTLMQSSIKKTHSYGNLPYNIICL